MTSKQLIANQTLDSIRGYFNQKSYVNDGGRTSPLAFGRWCNSISAALAIIENAQTMVNEPKTHIIEVESSFAGGIWRKSWDLEEVYGKTEAEYLANQQQAKSGLKYRTRDQRQSPPTKTYVRVATSSLKPVAVDEKRMPTFVVEVQNAFADDGKWSRSIDAGGFYTKDEAEKEAARLTEKSRPVVPGGLTYRVRDAAEFGACSSHCPVRGQSAGVNTATVAEKSTRDYVVEYINPNMPMSEWTRSKEAGGFYHREQAERLATNAAKLSKMGLVYRVRNIDVLKELRAYITDKDVVRLLPFNTTLELGKHYVHIVNASAYSIGTRYHVITEGNTLCGRRNSSRGQVSGAVPTCPGCLAKGKFNIVNHLFVKAGGSVTEVAKALASL